jgi:hypothetical protein
MTSLKVLTHLIVLMVENVYKKRPRRKMVRDPVTGEVNTNHKQAETVKKSTSRISRRDTFVDFRPMNQFQSKLITKKRLTVYLLRIELIIA